MFLTDAGGSYEGRIGTLENAPSGFKIESKRVTNWGTWGPWVFCPNNTYAAGFRLKLYPDAEPTEAWIVDNRGMTGLGLYCVEPGKHFDTFTAETITSSEDIYGSWSIPFRCIDGLLTGFNLQVQPYQGDCSPHCDDRATTNIQMVCSNSRTPLLTGDGWNLGSFQNDPERCGPKMAICGIRTQIEFEARDLSGLNNVDLYCCDVTDPAAICQGTDDFDTVLECENHGEVDNITCLYEYSVGMSLLALSEVKETNSWEVYASIEFGFDTSLAGASASFKASIGTSIKTGTTWSELSSENFQTSQTFTVQTVVAPQTGVKYVQVEGICYDFISSTTRIRIEDSDFKTKETRSVDIDVEELMSRSTRIR